MDSAALYEGTKPLLLVVHPRRDVKRDLRLRQVPQDTSSDLVEESHHISNLQPAALLRVLVVLVPVRLDQPEHRRRTPQPDSRLVGKFVIGGEDTVQIGANEVGSALTQARRSHVAVMQPVDVLGEKGNDVRVVRCRNAQLAHQIEHGAMPVGVETRRRDAFIVAN
eukprot:1979445-Pleurochrysis_carterae.AAC.6